MKKAITLLSILAGLLGGCGGDDEAQQMHYRSRGPSPAARERACEREMGNGDWSCCTEYHGEEWCRTGEDYEYRQAVSRAIAPFMVNDSSDGVQYFIRTGRKTARGWDIFDYEGYSKNRQAIADEFDDWDQYQNRDLCKNAGARNVRIDGDKITVVAKCRPEPRRKTCLYEINVWNKVTYFRTGCHYDDRVKRVSGPE